MKLTILPWRFLAAIAALLTVVVVLLAVVAANAQAHPGHKAPVSARAATLDMSCEHARIVAGHPNAYCINEIGAVVTLYFPWRTCQERVEWYGWTFWNVSVNHCYWWHH